MIILEKNLQFLDCGKVYTIGTKENGKIKKDFDFLICNTQIIINSYNPTSEIIYKIDTNKNNVVINSVVIENIQLTIYRTEKQFFVIQTNVLTPDNVVKTIYEIEGINFVENTHMNKYNAISDYE